MTRELPDKWCHEIASADPVPIVARKILRGRFEAVHLLFPLVARDSQSSVEDVHLLRVWTRRTVAAIRFFGDFLPRKLVRRAIKRLNRIRKTVNAARDCDVQIIRLKKLIERNRGNRRRMTGSASRSTSSTDLMDSNRKWLKSILRERKICQSQINDLYRRYARKNSLATVGLHLLESCCDVAQQPRQHFEISFEPWARCELHSFVDHFAKAFPSRRVGLKKLHQFRISAKQLRYTLELVACAIPLAMIEPVYQELERIQNELGRLNDLANAAERLKLNAKQSQRKSVRRRWDKLRRKSVRQLKQLHRRCLEGLNPAVFSNFAKQLDELARGGTTSGPIRVPELC
jgi:CHAD domain-containing protein